MQIKNLPKQVKMIKQRKVAGTCRDKMEKAKQGKITINLVEINQKVPMKEGRLKRYQQRVKQYRQNGTFQNKERKFYQRVEEDDTKTYWNKDTRETERFWTRIWEPRKHNEKAEWINSMTWELGGLEEGPKAEIYFDLLRKTLKKISNWKTQGHEWIQGLSFKKSISIHDRPTQMLTKSTHGWPNERPYW